MNGPPSDARTGTLGLLLTQEAVEDRVCRVYEAERDRIYRYLVALGVGRSEAQELTQDVFVQFYLAVRKGEEIQSARGWLLRLGHHEISEAITSIPTITARIIRLASAPFRLPATRVCGSGFTNQMPKPL